MNKVDLLKVKIFADGAEKASMMEMHSKPFVQGLTTNPTLMAKAGIKDYRAFCKDILSLIKDKPLSFEVFSDDFKEMERQALEIASWGDNVYVKIPITNTKQDTCYSLVKKLAGQGVKSNGAIWRINKNDLDSFPSDPHADRADKAEKLNLYNGEVFNSKNRKYLRTLSNKEMNRIYASIILDGEQSVIDKLEKNKKLITYLSKSKLLP